MKKLSIIIVNYNVKYYLEQCLVSVQKAIGNIDAEVFVVDNHSNDGSVAYLEHRFPDVSFVSINHNLGFARANNIGIRESEGEYVLLLNPDTFVGEIVLKECVDFMDNHPNAGACGVQMLQANGKHANESRRGVPDPMTAFYKMSGLCAHFPDNPRFGHYYMGNIPWNSPSKIEIVSGAFCMIRRKALDKVGLLDEDFFMYGEDIDLCYRILKGGFENWYLPCRILHYKGESTHKGSFRYVHVFYDAMLIFFRKHYGHLSVLLSIPIKSAIYFKAFAALIGMLVGKTRKSLGFFSPNFRQLPEYIFIGDEEAIAQCKKISREKGLFGMFKVCDPQNGLITHLDFLDSLDSQKTYHVIYDTDTFSFEKILDIFGSHPLPNVFIGTYNRHNQTIVTKDDIYRHE